MDIMVITYRLLFKFLTSKRFNPRFNFTQLELANLFGINQSNISSTMSGRKKPIQYIKVRGKNVRIINNSDLVADIIASALEKKARGRNILPEYMEQWAKFLSKVMGPPSENVRAAFQEKDLRGFLRAICAEAERNRYVGEPPESKNPDHESPAEPAAPSGSTGNGEELKLSPQEKKSLEIFRKSYFDQSHQDDEKEFLKKIIPLLRDLFKQIDYDEGLIKIIAGAMRTASLKAAEIRQALLSGHYETLPDIRSGDDNDGSPKKFSELVKDLLPPGDLTDEEKTLLRKLSLASFEGVQVRLLPELFKNQTDISLIPHLVTTGWIKEDRAIDASQDRIHIPLVFCHILQNEIKPDDCRTCLQEARKALDPSHSPRMKYSLPEIDDLCRILANAIHWGGKEPVPQIDELWKNDFALFTENQKSEAQIYKEIIRLYESISSANDYYQRKAEIFDQFGNLYLKIPAAENPDRSSGFNLRFWISSLMRSLQMMSYATVSYEKSLDFSKKCNADPSILSLKSFHLAIAGTMATGLAAWASRYYINDEQPDDPMADPDDYLKKAADAFAGGLQPFLSVTPIGEELPDFPLTLPLVPSSSYDEMPSDPFPSANELIKESSQARTFYNEGKSRFDQGNYIDALDEFRKSLEIYSRILSPAADGAENPFDGIVKVMKGLLPKTADAYHSFQTEMERRKELAANAK